MWRTGGTYVAFMLRERNPVALFYEPLHEDYSKFTREDWDRFSAIGAEASRGHPSKSFHYLTDYPFLPNGGVTGHRADFAWRPFVLSEADSAPELHAYLNGLLASARQSDTTPLFKFCRGFLRQRWLNAVMAPIVIYLARRPSGMMDSYERIGGGAYFYSAYLRILQSNRREPIFAPVYDYVTNASPQFVHADEETIVSDQLFALTTLDMARDVFLFFWALALAAHGRNDVMVLDANAIGSNRTRDAEALRRHCGLDADFSDAIALDCGDERWLAFHHREFAAFTTAALPLVASDFNDAQFSPALKRQLEGLLAL